MAESTGQTGIDECKALFQSMLNELESIREAQTYILSNLIQINNALNGTSNLGD